MAGHAFWKGFLRIGLVSIPVRAYSATNSGERITLNQLHEKCHSRIQYRKTCPIHGEVANNEIVSGYEFKKGEYVVIDTDELEKLRTDRDRNIAVEAFTPAGSVDSMYCAGKSYFVLPDAPIGQRPYQTIVEAMAQRDVEAIGQGILSRKEQLVLLRPLEGVLVMTSLLYAAEIKQPSEFRGDLASAQIKKSELELAKQLIGAMTTRNLNLSEYRDVYHDKLTRLIEARVEGRDVVAAPEPPAPKVINLIDAIKASMKTVKPVSGAKRKGSHSKGASALRQVVAANRKTAPRKRKSG